MYQFQMVEFHEPHGSELDALMEAELIEMDKSAAEMTEDNRKTV